MSLCESHLTGCFRDLARVQTAPVGPADPDARRAYSCVSGLKVAKLEGWATQHNRYAAASHDLFLQLRRDGLAVTACILLEQARANASDDLPLADQPKFVLLAHLLACLGPDLLGLIDQAVLTDRASSTKTRVETISAALLDDSSMERICFLNQRALALSEWFKRYAESLLKVTRQQAQHQTEALQTDSPGE